MMCLIGILLLFVDLWQYILFMSGVLQFADADEPMGMLSFGHFFTTLFFATIGASLLYIGYFLKQKQISMQPQHGGVVGDVG